MSPSKQILVTGGAGYIGSHVCKALAQKGYEPITLDNLSLGHAWAVKWGPLIEGNCGDQILLRKIFSSYNIEGVIHLAALSNVRESHQNPLGYYQNNVSATLSMLEMLKEQDISYFVFSSTCAVYGMPELIPIDETHSKKPISPYGWSKWMAEKILQESGVHVALLRYFNAAGADPDGEIGESHTPESHLIPLLIETALGKRDHFVLNGNDHATEDGTPVRDFIHVTDLAEAHVKALEALFEKKESLTLNLGTGQGYSIKEVINQIEINKKCTIPIVEGKQQCGDPPILIADFKKALKTLNWKPKLSNLSTIIETAWNWHSKQ